MSDPNEVIRTERQVVEHVLLTALTEGSSVACLFSKQDLQDLIFACSRYPFGDHQGERLSDLKKGMEQLLKEAFP